MQYCNNDPCETEALYQYRTPEGTVVHLCRMCREAFEWGQARPEVMCVPIEDDFDEEEE